MSRARVPAVVSALCLFALADVVHGQPLAVDQHGDALPAGALARLGTIRFRHDSPIVFAAFLPDGKGVLSAGDDGVVCAWEFPSGKPMRRFDALAGAGTTANGGTLSPDGKHLSLFCDDGFMRILDWSGAKELGKVALGTGTTTTTRSQAALARNAARGALLTPVYAHDGRTLLLAGSPRALLFVDLPAGKEIGPSPGHSDPLTSIAFTPDGRQVLTKDSRSASGWDAKSGKDSGTIAIKLPASPGNPILISPDGRFGVSVARFPTPASARAAKSRDAVLFETTTGKQVGIIALEVDIAPMHRRPLLFSPDGKLLAVNAGDTRETIELREVPSGKLVRTLDAGPVDGGGGKGGFGGGGPAGLGLARTAASKKLLFSPDGKALAFQAGAKATIVVLDTVSGKQIGALTPSDNSVSLLAFAPDGRCLATEKSDGSVTLYELATGNARRTYGGPQPARVLPKDDGFEDFLLGFGPSAAAKSKTSIALSPDGKLLAMATAGAIHVCDVLSGQELAVFKGHTLPVSALAFAPGGKTLASASEDTTGLIWDVTKIARPNPTKTAANLDTMWQTLADNDAAKAYAAMGELAGAPAMTIAWIKQRVQPAAPLDMKRVEDLIGKLGDGQFRVRDTATAELLKMGEQVLAALDQALAGNPSAEAKSRLEGLRTKLTSVTLTGERLQAHRAVEVLELIGTAEARQVLQSLAGGAAGALVSRSAAAALVRMGG